MKKIFRDASSPFLFSIFHLRTVALENACNIHMLLPQLWQDQMNVERDVDDENDGETLGRTGNV